MSSEEEEEAEEIPPSSPISEVDNDILRVLVSTDNHLGYCERDPVRGLDSFAAFEECLYLARKHKCDMVLIAGDLFHDNKPSRRTLHKTIEIIRRYCMGPEAVQIQIVSDQATNFRSVHGTVNYEDEFYSVDLPIFSIHGNHDDPTREGGTEMLAALDLLAVSNLVNYFGRQDEVDKVEVSPILIEKGGPNGTKVALYGMGSMRDERLNRMWRGKKVRFLRPEEGDWFHVFALHQNRDLGRGVKNCVHESMIPEWMDLVVWGHEHECLIEPAESVVGTFRITQPGSSVATSLTGGEAVRKQVGVLEIKANQFRLKAIPLTQVRSFVMGELSLQDQYKSLDPEDPKIDDKMAKILEDEVRTLVFEAREKRKTLLHDAAAAGNSVAHDNTALKSKLEKPDEVLIRLKVEHTGFSTLNNQRFGAKFVGDVANPADLLLFHRRKQVDGKTTTKKHPALAKPIAPEELEDMNIDVLIKENLDMADKKLEILSEQRLGLAVEDFVAKELNKAFADAMKETLTKQQKKLIKRGEGVGGDDEEEGESGKVTSVAKIRGIVQHESQQRELKEGSGTKTNGSKSRQQAAVEDEDEESLPEKETEENDVLPARKNKAATKPTSSSFRGRISEFDASDLDDEVVAAPPKSSSRSTARPRRSAVRSRVNYNEDESREDSESDAVVELDDNDDDSEVLEVQPKKRSKTTASTRRSAAKKTQKSVSKPSAKKAPRSFLGSGRRRQRTNEDSDDDEVPGTAYDLDDDWGTANTNTER